MHHLKIDKIFLSIFAGSILLLSCDDSNSSNNNENEATAGSESCVPDCIGRCSGDDGCGAQCPADQCEQTGQTCGESGQCEGECTPRSCEVTNATCGAPNDGCGGTLDCGICGEGTSCSAQFQCVDVNEACPMGFDRSTNGDCIERQVNCIKVRERGVTTHAPAGVRVLFSVTDCNDEPIRQLQSEDVTIINDERGTPFNASAGEGGSRSAPSTPSSYGLFSMLSLDMSGSIFTRNAQGAVFDAAEAFIRTVVINAPAGLKHKVAIQVFGRENVTQVVVPFTDNGDTLLTKINELRNNQQSLGSTDLYGAYLSSINELLQQGNDLELVERSLVIFTDGVHEAGDDENLRSQSLSALENGRAQNLTTFSVYLGQEGDADAISALRELASRPQYFEVATDDDLGSLTRVFEGVASKLDGIAKSNYVVGVCTPVYRPAAGGLTVQVSVGDAESSFGTSYSTSGFDGDVDACDAALLAEPCLNLQCGAGFISGVTCGTCGDIGLAGATCSQNMCECPTGGLAEEEYDGYDNDCDGNIDEGVNDEISVISYSLADQLYTVTSDFAIFDAIQDSQNEELNALHDTLRIFRSLGRPPIMSGVGRELIQLICNNENNASNGSCNRVSFLGGPVFESILNNEVPSDYFALLNALDTVMSITFNMTTVSSIEFTESTENNNLLNGNHSLQAFRFQWEDRCMAQSCNREFMLMDVVSANFTALVSDAESLAIFDHALPINIEQVVRDIYSGWVAPSIIGTNSSASFQSFAEVLMDDLCDGIDNTVGNPGFCQLVFIEAMNNIVEEKLQFLSALLQELRLSGSASLYLEEDNNQQVNISMGMWSSSFTLDNDIFQFNGCFNACIDEECPSSTSQCETISP